MSVEVNDDRWLMDRRDTVLKNARAFHMQAFLVAIFLLGVALTDEMSAYLSDLADIANSFENEIQDLRDEAQAITRSSLFNTSDIQTDLRVLEEQITLAKRISEELAQPGVTPDRLLSISIKRPVFVPLVVQEQHARRTTGLAELLSRDESKAGDLPSPPSRIELAPRAFWLMMDDSSWKTAAESISRIAKGIYADVRHWDEIGAPQVERLKKQAQQAAYAYISRIAHANAMLSPP